MHNCSADGASKERATAVLGEVGFSADQIASGMVNELSGGWRMKLAIACAMLQDATFLMLDEPTNHLDVNAVKWLIDYLCRLEGTTILFVSHDQDFLQKVATDVIHFADQKLSYYPGYAAFRAAQPDAALGAFKAFQVRTQAHRNDQRGVVHSGNSLAALASVNSWRGTATRPQRSERYHPRRPYGIAEAAAGSGDCGRGGGCAGGVDRQRRRGKVQLPAPGSAGWGAQPLQAHHAHGLHVVCVPGLRSAHPQGRHRASHTGRSFTAWERGRSGPFARNPREKGGWCPRLISRGREDEFKAVAGMRVANGPLRGRTVDGVHAQCSANGAGKTTLLRLLVGELYPRKGHGEVWRHHALRVAYIAQHSRHHLETCVHQTPIEYIQQRYFLGEDKEIAMSHGLMLTDEEQAVRRERGQVKKKTLIPSNKLLAPYEGLARPVLSSLCTARCRSAWALLSCILPADTRKT